MKLLITGAGGMVARAVENYSRGLGDDVIALSRAGLDIARDGAVLEVLSAAGPDAVINCAAYTDVDAAETHAEACYAANSRGVANLASACREIGSAFVTISTDYVFDGQKTGFYTQRDQPNPLGVYAKAKREGEVRAFEALPRVMIVRSGWIFGKGGRNFLSVLPRLLSEGRDLSAIADAWGTPTFAGDLARRLRELAEADLPGVYHVANSGPGCSYYDFAAKLCELGGCDAGLLRGASGAGLARPAPRPANSRLACLISERLGFAAMPDWEDALERFLRL